MIKQKFDEPKEQLEKEIKEQNNKLDPDNKMETYRFGIIYINEEDKFQMKKLIQLLIIYQMKQMIV